MTTIGVVGFGYWGPNIVRNFVRVKHCAVRWVADLRPHVLEEMRELYPTIQTTTDYHDILNDPETQAVVIATPVATHFSLAKEALNKKRHVLVEKPLTMRASEARELVALSGAKGKILMVDHTFLYTPAVQKIKEIITKKELGDVYYVDCVRTNLGLIQKDTNVIYDLATHDVSIIDYLFGTKPITVSATGIRNAQVNQASVAHISATYPNNLFVHAHVSWVSPIKIRTMMIVGTKKMLFYDDMEPSEKVKIYDKSVSITNDPNNYQLRIGYRSGDMVAPHLDLQEGLAGAATEFIRSIETRKKPLSDGASGVRVVEVIEGATASITQHGKTIKLL